MRPFSGHTPVRDALLLGAVQGPTELLPVSSSAHIALTRSLLGSRAKQRGDGRDSGGGHGGQLAEDDRRPDDLEDALEVALHGGAAIALLILGRRELARTVRELTPRRFAAGVLAAALPAAAGYLLERFPWARRDSGRSIATGLALGGAAMALADRAPQRRTLVDVDPRDGLALGAAQALALLPGVSRNGATLTAARARGFERGAAHALSWRVGLPVIVGATGLRVWRLRGRGLSPAERTTLAAGTGAAFASTLASAACLAGTPAEDLSGHAGNVRGSRAGGRHGWGASPLLPFALYRIALALLVARAQ